MLGRIALVVAISTQALTGSALANGRAPITNGVHFRSGDSHAVYVATTFGFLISHDDGCTFKWVCEQAIGYGGMFDPKYAIAGDGTIFATTFTGLRVSRDGGCTFTTATAEKPKGDPGNIADIWIDALDIGRAGEVWVATAESSRTNNVYRSIDNGVTFEPRNNESPTIWWKSVKVAPSDGSRVYLTGYHVAGTPAAHFARTGNAGTTWTETALANVVFGTTPVITLVAVSPTNRDIVFVRSIESNGDGDRLYRSADGGDTFTQVLMTAGPIRDVVFHDDMHVLVAAGAESFESQNGGTSFEALAGAPQLQCLGRDPNNQLVGCGANWQPDFLAVGRSAEGTTWEKLFRFVELAGPLECAAGTNVCESQWPAMKEQFGITNAGGCHAAMPDGPPIMASPGGCCDAGTGSPIALGGMFTLGFVVLRRRSRR